MQNRWFLFLFVLFACNSPAKQKQQVLSLKELSDLAVTEITVTKIIKASDEPVWYKVGDRKILISCEATIKAGIDLSQLTEDDISIKGKSITITLPKPKIISLNLPPGKIKVEYEETGMFRSSFSTAERDALVAQGEQQIRKSAAELGVLETANDHATLFITGFLKRLGYTTVTIQPKTIIQKQKKG
jgi:Protein of unknown function (DUF4230)